MALGSAEWWERTWRVAAFFWRITFSRCTRSVVWCAKFYSEISWELWLMLRIVAAPKQSKLQSPKGLVGQLSTKGGYVWPICFIRFLKSLMFACLRCWAIGMRWKSTLILTNIENHHTTLPKMLSVFEPVKCPGQVWRIRFFCST